MPFKTVRIAVFVGLCTLSATTFADTPVELVKIGDFSVTNLHLALFANQTGRAPEDAEGQIALLNELVNNFMVANSEEGRTLAEHPEVEAALEVARARLIAQTFVRTQMRNAPIDDARVLERYEQQYANAEAREFKARHILLKEEADARAVIEELDKGADFAKLAAERSIGPSKTEGGDLGWFAPADMVPAFSAAVQALADSAYSKDPIKTQFGWHVILREDSRQIAPPSLENVKADIVKEIQQQHVAEAISAIRSKTKLEVQNLGGGN